MSVLALALGAATGQAATPTPTPAPPTSTVAPTPTAAPLPTGAPLPTAAPVGKRTCEQFGAFSVAGNRYVVQNDRWGASTEQCVTGFDTGFTVDTAKHTNTAGPAAYPSIYRGCNYGWCTTASPFPRLVSDVGSLLSSWSTTGPTAGGVQQYNTSYDVWFDPSSSTTTGRNRGAELMIWLNHTSSVQPLGRKYGETTVAGTAYEVWYGAADPPVISFVRKAPTTSVTNLPLDAFVRAATSYGVVKPTWYLTSVQAGFEPWTGGTGLTTKSFSVTRNGL